jgi:hypothetical protein
MNQYKNIDFDFDIKAINKEINPDIGIEHE